MTETRPDFVLEEHLEYLDEFRESGVTNMFGATPYLQEKFPDLSNKYDARDVLIYWMRTFGERQPKQKENKITIKEKVNVAFRDLRKLGYFAKQNLGDCQSCGWSETPKGSEKVIFYHDQDAESWNENGGLDHKLYLAWAGDGHEIVNILEKNGLKVEWENESPGNRIAILP